MNKERTLYDILQVSEQAETEVIEAAYRRLSIKYHPDLNKSADATERMKELNRAYEVLRNPERRRQYDAELRNLHDSTAPAEKTDEETAQSRMDDYIRQVAPEVSCEVCGVIDSTVRVRIHPYVISALILAFRRASVGTLCNRCGKRIALRNIIVSLLIGLWGIPFGFFWTLGSVVTNIRGGEQPKEANGALLYNIGLVLFTKGHLLEATHALQASISFGSEAPAQKLIDTIASFPNLEQPGHRLYWGNGLQPRPERLGMSGCLVFFGIAATAFLAFWLFNSLASDTPAPAGIRSQANATATPTASKIPPGTSALGGARSQETRVQPQERQDVLRFAKELYPLFQVASNQIARSNVLNLSSGTKPNIAGWRTLAADAASLNVRIESLSDAPPQLSITYGLLRDWSRINKATQEEYVLYLQTEKETYLLSANQRIAQSNSKWTAFVNAFDEALKKHNISLSDLK